MEKPIYFSKIEYRESIADRLNSIMLLNTVEKNLSYQVFQWNRQMPAIQGTFSEEFLGIKIDGEIRKPAKVIRDANNGFNPQLFAAKSYEQKVVFSYGINLSDMDMTKILPLCNALEFEPYRNKEMLMGEEGYIGYRDEVNVKFTAITDSYISKLELPMSYYYDEEHIWPSEKLYRYLIKTYFDNNKKTKGWISPYGGFSLCIS